MVYRIMQLQYEPNNEETEIILGILFECSLLTKDMMFATISSTYTPDEGDLKVFTTYEYKVEEKGDGFKDLKLFPVNGIEENSEDGMLLIVEYAESIIATKGVKRIVGRYCTEGIFLLKPNDKIRTKHGGIIEEFVALQFENKMYLVKLYNI